MFVLSSVVRTYRFILPAMLFFQLGGNTAYRVSQQPETASKVPSVSMVIWTDRVKYSLGDEIQVSGALQNDGDEPWYVDRRIAWTGGAGGLELEIRDERGKILPVRFLSDAIMPQPKEGDTSVFIRLEPGFLYGSYMQLEVRPFFPKPGRYSLRALYKSWLFKDTIAPQLRNLPALWKDSSYLISKPVWIEVISTTKKMRR